MCIELIPSIRLIVVWLKQSVHGTNAFIYLSRRVEHLSRGLVRHTCTHCGPTLSKSERDRVVKKDTVLGFTVSRKRSPTIQIKII